MPCVAYGLAVPCAQTIARLGIKHVRGILLYGPPGTGKTLLARQIGKMLNSHEPKVPRAGAQVAHSAPPPPSVTLFSCPAVSTLARTPLARA